MKRELILLGLATIVALPTALAAQGPPNQPDSTELVFEREEFRYPQFERRNPFAPLLTAAEGGPRFERLRLLAILYDPDPERSLVTFTDAAGGDGPRSESFRRRVGERIGNSVVVEIRPDQVVLEVDEFGLTERRVLQKRPRTQGQGGP